MVSEPAGLRSERWMDGSVELVGCGALVDVDCLVRMGCSDDMLSGRRGWAG